jgi:hypothetical protein
MVERMNVTFCFLYLEPNIGKTLVEDADTSALNET